ncbi:uncharacterized protein [Rutidosis leptorrhynchoides]|uniref:uncharacterized protein isoform X2 n=1 Tax=Rutidosis leptorrhynchoides TaxID=125765 RepID=UPI003A9A0FC5
MNKKQMTLDKQQTSESTAYNELIKKKVVAPCGVDWEPLENERLDMKLTGMLTQHYKLYDGGRTYFYEDLKELVDKHAQLPIYTELCCEFHSTYLLKEQPKSVDDNEFMRFKLGGMDRQMSLMDFTRCLQIYSDEQMGGQHFWGYIWSGSRVSAISKWEEDFSNTDKVWKEFSRSGSTWSPGQVSFSDVDMVSLRLFHLVLTRNITHRTVDNNMVSLSDLWFLENIRTLTHVNIPYCVAYYLKYLATDLHSNSPICGGHYVTLIARHFLVKCDAYDEELLERRLIGASEYSEANVFPEPIQEEPETDSDQEPETDSDQEEPETESPSIPYTTAPTREIVKQLTNLKLMYEETLSDKNQLEKLNQEGNLSENIQLVLEQVDEFEKIKEKYIAEMELQLP